MKPTTNSTVGLLPLHSKSIKLYFGNATELLAGWVVCDGGTYNGIVTPNLTEDFVKISTGNGDLDFVKVPQSTKLPNTLVTDSHSHNHKLNTVYLDAVNIASATSNHATTAFSGNMVREYRAATINTFNGKTNENGNNGWVNVRNVLEETATSTVTTVKGGSHKHNFDLNGTVGAGKHSHIIDTPSQWDPITAPKSMKLYFITFVGYN
jgi:hypothetical protein